MAKEFESESIGITDPRDYRRGMLFGSILVVAGALLGILSFVTSVEEIQEGAPVAVMAIYYFGFALSGMLIFSGLLLVRRGKLGLWGMYFLSALFIYSFCFETVDRLVSHTQEDAYGIMMGGILLFLWLSLTGYFHNRPKLFTGWWGSKNEA
jgi:hypothetical protein